MFTDDVASSWCKSRIFRNYRILIYKPDEIVQVVEISITMALPHIPGRIGLCKMSLIQKKCRTFLASLLILGTHILFLIKECEKVVIIGSVKKLL